MIGFQEFLSEFAYRSPKLFLTSALENPKEYLVKRSQRGLFKDGLVDLDKRLPKRWKSYPEIPAYNYIYILPENLPTLDFNGPRAWQIAKEAFKPKSLPVNPALADRSKMSPVIEELTKKGIIGKQYPIVKIGDEYHISVNADKVIKNLKLIDGHAVRSPFDAGEGGKLNPDIIEMISTFIDGFFDPPILKYKKEIHAAYPPQKMTLYRGFRFTERTFMSVLSRFGLNVENFGVGDFATFFHERASHWTKYPPIAKTFATDGNTREGPAIFSFVFKADIPAKNVVLDVGRVSEIDKLREEREVIVHEVPGLKARISNIHVREEKTLQNLGYHWDKGKRRIVKIS